MGPGKMEMNMTKSKLKQIIKEELQHVLGEVYTGPGHESEKRFDPETMREKWDELKVHVNVLFDHMRSSGWFEPDALRTAQAKWSADNSAGEAIDDLFAYGQRDEMGANAPGRGTNYSFDPKGEMGLRPGPSNYMQEAKDESY
jgi:hypothetical protein